MRAQLWGYWALLQRRRDFRWLWLAAVVSQAGDWFNTIATVVLVNRYAGGEASGLALSGLFLARTLPTFLLSPVAGVMADRLNRKWVMMGSDLLRAAVVLGLLAVNSSERVWLLYALLVVQFAASAFFEPAKRALVPQLVSGRDELVAANTLEGATWSAMLTIGAALGGLVTGVFGVQTALIVDAATFGLSAGLVGLISRAGAVEETAAAAGANAGVAGVRGGGLGDFVAGVRYVTQRPELAVLTQVKAMAQVGNTDVLLGLLAAQVFVIGEGGATALGWMYASFGVGAVVGPLVADGLGDAREETLLRWVTGGFVMVAIGWMVLGLSGALWLTLLALFIRGMGGSINWVYSSALMQFKSEDAVRGRVFSLDFASFTLASAVAVVWTGALVDGLQLSPRGAALVISGIAVVALGVWVTAQMWLRGRAKRLAQAGDVLSSGD